MQLKNLSKDYVRDDLVRKLFKYLKFLPFVPLKDSIKAFKKIKEYGENSDKFQPMFTYFERIYIGKLVKDSSTIRKMPICPIKSWNVMGRLEKNKGKNQ